MSGGSYFLTVALAENLEDGTQVYVDRVADVVLLKVLDPSPQCTGIAYMPFNMEITESNNEK